MYPLSTLLRGCWTEINLHLRLKLSFLRYRFILRKYSFLNNNNNNNNNEEFLNIAINVYEIEEKQDDTYSIEFRYPSQNYKDRKCVNLLIYKNHVVGIKNIFNKYKCFIKRSNNKKK
jgi:hypothetical protein